MNDWVIHSVAYFMADIIEAGMDDNGEVHYGAKVKLYDVFGDVPDGYRAAVYLKLLDILTDRGVSWGNDLAVH